MNEKTNNDEKNEKKKDITLKFNHTGIMTVDFYKDVMEYTYPYIITGRVVGVCFDGLHNFSITLKYINDEETNSLCRKIQGQVFNEIFQKHQIPSGFKIKPIREV